MNILTADGDRSGVSTPSHIEKSKHKVEAANVRLKSLIDNWENVKDQKSTITDVIESLKSVILFLDGTDH